MTKWPLIILAYVTLFSLSIIDNSRGPAYPDILSHFHISSTRGSFMFAIATASGLISSLSARWWLHRFTIVQSSSFSLLCLFMGSLCFGLSARFGLFFLDLASMIMGIGMGCSNICMNLLISRGTSDKYRRQFFSGLHSIYGIGSLSAPLLLSLSYSINKPWPQFFIVISIIPLLTFLWSLKISPHQLSLATQPRPQSVPTLALTERVSIGSIFGFYVASEVMISSRLVYYLEQGHNIPLGQARLALSLFFAMLLLGRLLFTIIPFKGRSETWLKISCSATLLIFTFSLLIDPRLMSLTGLTMSFFYPLGMEWLSRNYADQLEQMMASILTSVSVALISMHLLFGVITDLLGINIAILATYILQGGALLFILLFTKKKIRQA
jgi:MFS transporter, FHS family, glucose/mannose:H+ symporter